MSQVEDSQPDTSQDAQMAAVMELVRAKGVAWAAELLKANCQDDSGIATSSPPTGQEPDEEAGLTRSKRVRRATNKEFPANPPPYKSRAADNMRTVVPSVAAPQPPSVGPVVPLPTAMPVTDFATWGDLGKLSDTLLNFMTELRAGLRAAGPLPGVSNMDKCVGSNVVPSSIGQVWGGGEGPVSNQGAREGPPVGSSPGLTRALVCQAHRSLPWQS